jgi:RNA polymerase sigma-B factor
VRERRDATACEELANRLMALVRSVARRYDHVSEALDDLIQVGCVGLVKAIHGFEPERGYAFTTCAVPKIHGEIRRHLRDTSWALHVPRSAQERALELSRETKRLETERGRDPSRRELAERLGWDVAEVLAVQQAADAYSTASLEATSLRRRARQSLQPGT